MKSQVRWGICLIAFIFVFNFASTRLDGSSFVDPQLNAWLAISAQGQSLAKPKQDVVVYLKAPAYKDRSGLTRAQALFEEQSFSESYLRDASKEIVTLLPLQNKRIDYLWSSNAMIVQVDRDGLRRLSRHPLVDGIISDYIITLDDPKTDDSSTKTDETKTTYGLQLIHASKAWDQGITGRGVTIGIIDSGIDDTHPDLKDKVILKKDFTEENNNVDGHGHGTHVAGTIAGGNASGTAIGVAPEAKLIVAKGLNKKGGGSLAGLLKAMEFMLNPDGDPQTNDAPKLVSNSWGASSQFTYGFRNIIRTWRRFGIFPNFAAGNSGPIPFSANAPGSYPFSFAVGAVDEDGKATSFSSRGPTIWWKSFFPIFVTKPEIAAPGLNVKSSMPGGSWRTMSGTSMATPHIAGVAALALQVNPSLTVEQLTEVLKSSGLDRGRKGKDNRYGNGIVQVDQVIEKATQWHSGTSLYFLDKDPSSWEWDTP